jgi:PAS domain S-box-containing protein
MERAPTERIATKARTGLALVKGESQFRQLLEKLPAGAYTCDSDGLITYFNQHATKLWGRSPKLNDPVDRFCGSFKLFSTEGHPIAHNECWMAKALTTDREYNGHEIVIERPDGQRLTALAHANPIRDNRGRLLGAVNVLVDISDRKRVEDILKNADRSKNEFLATLAHELRNPLAPIRSAAEILHARTPDVPEAQWALEVIDRQVTQMTRLIDDLLDIGRIASNKLELRMERVELGDVLQGAIETSRPLLDSSGHDFEATLPSEPIHLEADATRLAQVVSNLLNNAAKYTERGGRIRLAAERRGTEAVIRVSDSGIGIPSEMISRIFEMFTQADRSVDRSQGGLGVGLTLARRLVELHGGTIEARSEGSGMGSEFVVRLPAIARPITETPRGGKRSNVLDFSSSLRVLVVDDNEDSAAGLGILLEMTGNEVRTAHDGIEALGAAESFRPHVVLLDIGLPKMDGYDVARTIRRQPWGERTVLIAVTGWGEASDRLRSGEAGFDHHLVKPVDIGGLMRLLSTLEREQLAPADRLPDA